MNHKTREIMTQRIKNFNHIEIIIDTNRSVNTEESHTHPKNILEKYTKNKNYMKIHILKKI